MTILYALLVLLFAALLVLLVAVLVNPIKSLNDFTI